MRHLFAGLVAISLAASGALAGAGPVRATSTPAGPVEPSESAALFVGVREFLYDRTLTDVRYAVDDAVDLAFLLSIERTPRLVEPRRVILSLSGDPQKKESKEKLRRLREAGASVRAAGQSDVLTLLEAQSRAVGANGLLIVAVATHGVNDGGTQYLLTASSVLRHRGQTSLSEATIRDVISRAGVGRALVLLDACRERLTRDIRAGEADPRSSAAMMKALGEVTGHVVLSAAAEGQYAYDDDAIGNGVFTAAVMDGLRCSAATNEEGFVTVDTLSTYVEARVLEWVRRNQDRNARVATQLQCQGLSKRMPLSACATGSERAAEPRVP